MESCSWQIVVLVFGLFLIYRAIVIKDKKD